MGAILDCFGLSEERFYDKDDKDCLTELGRREGLIIMMTKIERFATSGLWEGRR